MASDDDYDLGMLSRHLAEGEKCERCPAMERKLIEAVRANRSLFRQIEVFAKELEQDQLRIKELVSKCAALAKASKWGIA